MGSWGRKTQSIRRKTQSQTSTHGCRDSTRLGKLGQAALWGLAPAFGRRWNKARRIRLEAEAQLDLSSHRFSEAPALGKIAVSACAGFCNVLPCNFMQCVHLRNCLLVPSFVCASGLGLARHPKRVARHVFHLLPRVLLSRRW